MTEPLHGIRIVELGGYGAAPFCTMMLGDLGAEVIKVEPPSGDPYRENPPFYKDESLYFMSINRNKRTLCLNLKSEEDYQKFKGLMRETDVLVQNLGPGIDQALRVDYPTLSKEYPGLIYCAISGFGKSGPLSKDGGYDLIIQAYTGLMLLAGREGDPPLKVAPAVPDIVGAMCAALAVVACVVKRKCTGLGEFVDISLFDSTLYSLALAYLPYYLGTGSAPGRWGSAHWLLVPMQAFKGADSCYFVTGVTSDAMWTRFCRAIERPDLAERFPGKNDRAQARNELDGQLAEMFATKPSEYWLKQLSENGIPCAPVLNLAEAFAHPQAQARNMLQVVDHPKVGPITVIGSPFKFSNGASGIRLPPPSLEPDS